MAKGLDALHLILKGYDHRRRLRSHCAVEHLHCDLTVGYETSALDAVFDQYIKAATDDSKCWFDFGTSNEDDGRKLNKSLSNSKSEFGAGGIAHEFYEINLRKNRRNDMSIQDCVIIELPKIGDPRGNLTFVESNRHIPFEIKRVFYLYDVPGGETRAGHALKTCHQLLIANSGSFDVIVDDGNARKHFQLNRSHYGLYIPPFIWREIENFSSNSICTVLASEFYDAENYYRDYDDYLRAVIKNSK